MCSNVLTNASDKAEIATDGEVIKFFFVFSRQIIKLQQLMIEKTSVQFDLFWRQKRIVFTQCHNSPCSKSREILARHRKNSVQITCKSSICTLIQAWTHFWNYTICSDSYKNIRVIFLKFIWIRTLIWIHLLFNSLFVLRTFKPI